MKNFYCLFFTALFITGLQPLYSQPLLINPGQTPSQLVNAIVQGGGILASNIGGTVGATAAATFTNNGVANFTLSGGIILSTGNLNMNNPSSFHASTDVNMPGDADLNALIVPHLTEDAQVLTFDFQATSDSVEFNFVFSSEEYNDYANTNFNDVFAFFVTGPGYAPNTNVAVLPGTSTIISINNVNNGNSGGVATGPCENCSYYIDNVGVNGPIALSPDGFTIPIKIKFPVWACSPYTFKIAIADVADGIFDSQVMIEQNSFLACPLMQIMQQSVPITNTVNLCNGGAVVLTAPAASSYSWTTGDTTQSIIVTQPGSYSYFVNVNTCFSFSNTINVIAQGTTQPPAISQQGNVLISYVQPGTISYQWYYEGALIPGATASTYAFTMNGCYTLSVLSSSGCEALSNIVCIVNTGMVENNSNDISVFPNPVSDISTIQSPFVAGSRTTLILTDVTGRILRNETFDDNGIIAVGKGLLSEGIYFVAISNSASAGIFKSRIVVL
jgi:hypothetical protein